MMITNVVVLLAAASLAEARGPSPPSTSRRVLLLQEQSRRLQDQAAWHEKAAAAASAAAKKAADAASAVAEQQGLDVDLLGDQISAVSGQAWSFVTEVSDQAAAQTTAALRSGLGDMQSMAFSFLKLSDEMVKVLKEMVWNLVTVVFLLVAARYLPVDVMLVVVLLTLFFGPFLVSLTFSLLGFLGFLACWAPNVLHAGFVAALFVMSHVGKALLRSCGVSPEAIAHIPGIDAAVRVVRACYAAAKGRLRKTAPFVKLDDIEAAAGKIKAEPSVEARLATIEELLQRAYGELAAKGASGTPANQTQAPGVISRFNA